MNEDEKIKVFRLFEEIEKELYYAENIYKEWPENKVKACSIIIEGATDILNECINYEYKSIKNNGDMRKEAIKTAAMCIRFIKNL